jgi:hypothetical protein
MTKHQRSLLAVAAVSTLATATLACQQLNTPLYFQGPTFQSTGGGPDEPMATSGLALRFRAPTMQERMQLDAKRDAVGYDMDIPWISRDKVHVEVSYKVSYVCPLPGEEPSVCTDRPPKATYTLIVDGASEYTKYDTQATADALGGEDPIILPLITTLPRTLAMGASFSGLVREDDFAEAELDLDALGRWNDATPASPTFAGVLINRSDVNPVGLNLVPTNLVVPAMFEIDVRLQTDTPMLVEYFVRVRDDDDRLWHDAADDVYQPAPTLFQPPAIM